MWFRFLNFVCQLRGYPDQNYSSFETVLIAIKGIFKRNIGQGFVRAVFNTCKIVITQCLFSSGTGNPIFLVLRLAFAIALLFFVYRVIKRAINKA